MLRDLLVQGYRGYNRLRNGARTIGAAAVIIDSDQRIVLVRLSYRGGLWGLPGGFSSRDEGPDATVRREVLEEVGIPVDAVSNRPAVKLDNYHRHLSFVYLLHSDHPPNRPKRLLRRLEIREVGRFSLDALPRLYEGTDELLTAALKPDIEDSPPRPPFAGDGA